MADLEITYELVKDIEELHKNAGALLLKTHERNEAAKARAIVAEAMAAQDIAYNAAMKKYTGLNVNETAAKEALRWMLVDVRGQMRKAVPQVPQELLEVLKK